jgi:hypothetical protein
VPGGPVTLRILQEMHRVAAAHGARLILVYLPHRSEIEGDHGRNGNIRGAHALGARLSPRPTTCRWWI